MAELGLGPDYVALSDGAEDKAAEPLDSDSEPAAADAAAVFDDGRRARRRVFTFAEPAAGAPWPRRLQRSQSSVSSVPFGRGRAPAEEAEPDSGCMRAFKMCCRGLGYAGLVVSAFARGESVTGLIDLGLFVLGVTLPEREWPRCGGLGRLTRHAWMCVWKALHVVLVATVQLRYPLRTLGVDPDSQLARALSLSNPTADEAWAVYSACTLTLVPFAMQLMRKQLCVRTTRARLAYEDDISLATTPSTGRGKGLVPLGAGLEDKDDSEPEEKVHEPEAPRSAFEAMAEPAVPPGGYSRVPVAHILHAVACIVLQACIALVQPTVAHVLDFVSAVALLCSWAVWRTQRRQLLPVGSAWILLGYNVLLIMVSYAAEWVSNMCGHRVAPAWLDTEMLDPWTRSRGLHHAGHLFRLALIPLLAFTPQAGVLVAVPSPAPVRDERVSCLRAALSYSNMWEGLAYLLSGACFITSPSLLTLPLLLMPCARIVLHNTEARRSGLLLRLLCCALAAVQLVGLCTFLGAGGRDFDSLPAVARAMTMTTNSTRLAWGLGLMFTTLLVAAAVARDGTPRQLPIRRPYALQWCSCFVLYFAALARVDVMHALLLATFAVLVLSSKRRSNLLANAGVPGILCAVLLAMAVAAVTVSPTHSDTLLWTILGVRDAGAVLNGRSLWRCIAFLLMFLATCVTGVTHVSYPPKDGSSSSGGLLSGVQWWHVPRRARALFSSIRLPMVPSGGNQELLMTSMSSTSRWRDQPQQAAGAWYTFRTMYSGAASLSFLLALTLMPPVDVVGLLHLSMLIAIGVDRACRGYIHVRLWAACKLLQAAILMGMYLVRMPGVEDLIAKLLRSIWHALHPADLGLHGDAEALFSLHMLAQLVVLTLMELARPAIKVAAERANKSTVAACSTAGASAEATCASSGIDSPRLAGSAEAGQPGLSSTQPRGGPATWGQWLRAEWRHMVHAVVADATIPWLQRTLCAHSDTILAVALFAGGAMDATVMNAVFALGGLVMAFLGQASPSSSRCTAILWLRWCMSMLAVLFGVGKFAFQSLTLQPAVEEAAADRTLAWVGLRRVVKADGTTSTSSSFTWFVAVYWDDYIRTLVYMCPELIVVAGAWLHARAAGTHARVHIRFSQLVERVLAATSVLDDRKRRRRRLPLTEQQSFAMTALAWLWDHGNLLARDAMLLLIILAAWVRGNVLSALVIVVVAVHLLFIDRVREGPGWCGWRSWRTGRRLRQCLVAVLGVAIVWQYALLLGGPAPGLGRRWVQQIFPSLAQRRYHRYFYCLATPDLHVVCAELISEFVMLLLLLRLPETDAEAWRCLPRSPWQPRELPMLAIFPNDFSPVHAGRVERTPWMHVYEAVSTRGVPVGGARRARFCA